MDKDTLIESLLYRCEGRGESYQAFVQEYCSREDIIKAMQSDDPTEARVARLLIAYDNAHSAFLKMWLPIADAYDKAEKG